MIDKFINFQGKYFDLSSSLITNETSKFDALDKEYAKKALDYMNKNHVSVFYSLKHITDGYFDYAQYFFVPVSDEDIKSITQSYSYNHIVGVIHCKEPSDTSSKMSGYDYEYKCADFLRKHGFINVELTKLSGDQGIDIIAIKDDKRFGIQCKSYANPVSNKAVQEAYSGAEFYGCDIPVVMTNTTFTKSARELAENIGVKLWENIEIS